MKHTLLIFCCFLVLTSYGFAQQAMPEADVLQSIEVTTLTKGRDGGTTWFLPRVCRLPRTTFMTLQEITGSDYYGPVHSSESTDNGNTWTKPQPVPPENLVYGTRRDPAGLSSLFRLASR